jgi:glycine/D-amino acid oxidase-like deaminating enzyme
MTGCDRQGGSLVLTTDRQTRVYAERVVLALGYEVPPSLRHDLVKLVSTYAVITEPLDEFPGWEDRCLIWETARPYRYARSTVDGRVILGGEDEPFRDPARRDRLLPEKGRNLAKHLHALFPDLEAEPAFVWTGTFGETEDGLPYVGEHPRLPGVLFALGYGGNGITFGAIAANLIRDCCQGRPNPDLELFRLDRESAGSLLRA